MKMEKTAMPTLAERLQSPGVRLGVKQFRLVLEFATAIEDELLRRRMKKSAFAIVLGKSKAWVSKVLRKKQNLTFFTAVEIADALDMDVKIHVVPRPTNVIHLAPRVVANGAVSGPVLLPTLKPLECDAA